MIHCKKREESKCNKYIYADLNGYPKLEYRSIIAEAIVDANGLVVNVVKVLEIPSSSSSSSSSNQYTYIRIYALDLYLMTLILTRI